MLQFRYSSQGTEEKFRNVLSEWLACRPRFNQRHFVIQLASVVSNLSEIFIQLWWET